MIHLLAQVDSAALLRQMQELTSAVHALLAAQGIQHPSHSSQISSASATIREEAKPMKADRMHDMRERSGLTSTIVCSLPYLFDLFLRTYANNA